MRSFLFIFLFACLHSPAQDTLKFNVRGSVKSSLDKTAVPNCPLTLKGSDGTLIQFKTDAEGNYSIPLKQETTYEVYTQTDKAVTTPTARLGFLASDDHGSFTTVGLKVSMNFQKDFELQQVIECEYRLPLLIFKKGKAEIDTLMSGRLDGMDSTFDYATYSLGVFANVLSKNPTIVIELSAHCSSEETVSTAAADQLSQKRAAFIKAELVKRGIAPDRIVPKGWGERKLKIQDIQIAKEKTKEGKEALHAINRRCIFKILSWDYPSSNAAEPESPAYNPVKDKVVQEKTPEQVPAKRKKEHKLEIPVTYPEKISR